PVYVGSVVLLIGYLLASSMTARLENRWIAALLNPFGGHAIDSISEYWSIAEKNARTVPLQGLFLWNRVLWLGASAALLALTFARFAPVHGSGAEGGRGGEEEKDVPEPAAASPVRATPGPVSGLAILPELTWLALRETVKNTYFLVILLCGVLFLAVTSR